MIEAKLEAWSDTDAYLTVDTDEWLADRGIADDDATESLRESLAGDYATDENILAWLKSQGWQKVTGIYGENGPVSIATVNEDTLLTRDIGIWFGHVERLDADGYAEAETTYLIETASDYYMTTAPDVYEFNGDDDGDAFSYSRAYGQCDGPDHHPWDTDDTVTLNYDGGYSGRDVRIDEHIVIPPGPDGEPARELAYIACPTCDKPLHFYAY